MQIPSVIPVEPLALQTFYFPDTRGGMNQSRFLGEINENEAAELQNIVMAPGTGAWQNRQGSAAFRNAETNGNDFRAMLDYQYWTAGDTSPTRKFVAIAGDQWVYDDGAGWTAIGTIADVDNAALIRYRNLALMADGTNFQQWDGTTKSTVSGTVPAANRLAVHKNRLFANDLNNHTFLYYTMAGYHTAWNDDAPPSGSGLPNDAGILKIDWVDVVSALHEWGDFLAVFGRNNIWLLSGSSPDPTGIDPFRFMRIVSGYGTTAPGSVVTAPGVEGERLFFQAPDKHFYEVSLRAGVEDGGVALRISSKIAPLIDTLADGYVTVTRGVYDTDLNAILWTCQRTGTAGDAILCYFIEFNAWTYWTGITARALGVIEDSNDRPRLFAGNSAGQMQQLRTGNDDSGTAISKRIRTRVYTFGEPNALKRIDNLTPSLYQRVNGAMSWAYLLDSAVRVDPGTVTYHGSNLPYWGSGVWGLTPWVTSPVLEQPLRIGKTGRHVQFQFLNEEDGHGNEFALSGLAMAVQLLARY